MNWQIIVDIANVVVAVGVLFAITQININRKQLHLATLNRCIDEFRKMPNVKSQHASEKDVLSYVDFVNEELFYIQHKYLPEIVAFEWLDGMIDYFPITNKRNEILNVGNCVSQLEIKRDFFLKDYPRLKKTFSVKNDYDFVVVYNKDPERQSLRILTRKKIVQEIYKNVRRFEF